MKQHPPIPRRSLAGILACALAAGACADQPRAPTFPAGPGGADRRRAAAARLQRRSLPRRGAEAGRRAVRQRQPERAGAAGQRGHHPHRRGERNQRPARHRRGYAGQRAAEGVRGRFGGRRAGEQLSPGGQRAVELPGDGPRPRDPAAGQGGGDRHRPIAHGCGDGAGFRAAAPRPARDPVRPGPGAGGNAHQPGGVDRRAERRRGRAGGLRAVRGRRGRGPRAGHLGGRGGGVYCMFTHTFTATGQHPVEIRLENVSPADYDPSDNSGSRTINVVPQTASPSTPSRGTPAAPRPTTAAGAGRMPPATPPKSCGTSA